jgi:hypothetical protein
MRNADDTGFYCYRAIKAAANPLRHGDVSSSSSDDLVKLLVSTWDVVDGYLNSV